MKISPILSNTSHCDDHHDEGSMKTLIGTYRIIANITNL